MIWFDLDNSPHVPIFRPIFRELQLRNIPFFVTARDYAQTKSLLDLYNIPYLLIGRHGGKNTVKKVLNLSSRSMQLYQAVKNKDIELAVSHGSRTQIITAKLLGIKTLLMLDYEYTEHGIFNLFSDNILMPKIIPESRISESGIRTEKVLRYNGFKEELYLKYFSPDPSLRTRLNISEDVVLIVIRPPSLVGNYHNIKSEQLLIAGINYFSKFDNVVCLIVNRIEKDKKFILSNVNSNNIRFLKKPVDGLQLLYAADIVISGGGTMNREAALLGTKTYSIFTGKRPFLDEYLQSLKRLRFIAHESDFNDITPKRQYHKNPIYSNGSVAVEVVDKIMQLTRMFSLL